MKKLFNADLVTIRSLFTNEYNANDRDKNYYIPLYQREYNWEKKHILKLFDDIYKLAEDEKKFQPYFLGGIVFSRQSMEGEDRTNVSLEVIDGQQRLTTLSILIALIIQSLKFEGRKFDGKEDFIKDLIEKLTSYTITKRFDKNYKVSTVLKVERSDQLQETYEKVILNLINKKIKYIDYNYLDGDNRKFFNNIRALHKQIKDLNENDLIHFILQLLDHTEIVVTKTDSFETGYLVFEKLNDSGKGLSAHDLLKNYLFSIRKKEDDTKEIKSKWENLITIIDSIEPKLTPKDFLEFYLIITGNNYKSSTTTDIFAGYKDYFKEKSLDNILVLNNMLKIAEKLKIIKNSDYAGNILNEIGFKLGLLIFLSFYNKYTNEFCLFEKRIFNLVFRLGYILLITNDLKIIKKIVTDISINISSKNYITPEDCFIELENTINEIIKNKRDDFENALLNENRFKREHFSIILFDLINIECNLPKLSDDVILEKIMPDDFNNSNYNFNEIGDDNINKYSNAIGNLLLYSINSKPLPLDFNERKKVICEFDNNVINDTFNKKIKSKFNDLELYNIDSDWDKETIIKRTQVLTKIAIDFFINNEMNTDNLF